MATQALYLKYRPQTFEEVVGQEPITHTLRNALRQGRVRHAYLFTGPRGTGKTTMARLLAKAVNCQAPEEERPCNACPICVAVTEGRLLDLIEIDAASNRGIDEIRDIREKVGFRPNQGRFKIYVLDEAHMLTEPAFNALLKTLEEPPPHVIFMLVTTDPHKIPATISSRCQRFDFKRIRLQAIVDRLAYVAEQEDVTVEPAALEFIARQGTGALRDAVSLLDQLTSYGDEITLEQVQMVLGTVASESAAKLVACLAEGDVAGGLGLINRAMADGADPRQFGREVVEYLRGLLLIKEGAGTRLLNATTEQASEMGAQAEKIPLQRLLRAIGLFNEAVTDLRRGLHTIPQLPLEMALVGSTLEPKGPGAAPRQGSEQGPAQKQEPARKQGSAHEQERTRNQEPVRKQGPARPAPAQSAYSPAKPEARRVAEQPASDLVRAEVSSTTTSAPGSGATLSLEHVQARWEDVIGAVYDKNRMTAAVLRSNCQPVDLLGDELVISFDSDTIREKLSDPSRRMEVQEALEQVLGATCRLKLVLASHHAPRQPANPGRPAPVPSEPEPEAEPLDDQAVSKITRWAEERGGQARVVGS